MLQKTSDTKGVPFVSNRGFLHESLPHTNRRFSKLMNAFKCDKGRQLQIEECIFESMVEPKDKRAELWIYVNILDTIFFVFTHIFSQIL